MRWNFLKKSLLISMFSLNVGSVSAQELRDIKSPVLFPQNYWVFILCGVFALVFIFLFFLKRFLKQNKKDNVVLERICAYVLANQKLDNLLTEDLLRKGLFEVFYIKLTDIVREYFENQFAVRAPEMTTEEFLITIKSSNKLSFEQKEKLKTFLSHCDMVKFAKYSPEIDEGKKSIEFAKELIEDTKDDTIKIVVN